MRFQKTIRGAAALALLAGVALMPLACGEDDEPLVGTADAPYEVTLPSGWQEASEEQREAAGVQAGEAFEAAAGQDVDVPNVGVTSLWSRGEFGDEVPNVIVITEPLPQGISPAQFVTVSIDNAQRAFSAQLIAPPREVEPITVAGEGSRAFDYRVRFGDQELGKRVVFIFREDSVYTLTLTSLPADFRQATAELDEILASWQWS